MSESGEKPPESPKLKVIKGEWKHPRQRAIERAARFYDRAKEIDPSDPASIAYVARVLAQVTMPHSRPTSNEFERTNGSVRLRMLAPAKVGLPFGTYPRLILAWMATEAKLTNSPELELGDSLSAFMRELDLIPRGGRWGSITRLREQLGRLVATTISWTTSRPGERVIHNVPPVREARLWWDPKRPNQTDLWQSTLRLDEEFFHALTEHSVPVNMEALKVLAHERSPMAIDIYTWLTYRMSYLEEPVVIPWRSLQQQFGGSDELRTRRFKELFLERLKFVHQVYPAARVRPSENRRKPGLILEPSPTHVPKLIKPRLKLKPGKPPAE